MRASIDTDIVIHLYLSNKQELFMHEYLYKIELKKKSFQAYEKFTADVTKGKVIIKTNKALNEMGIKNLFDGYKRDYKYLFDSGELYAVALAKAMGLFAFVSDDIKEFGPHETLVKELIEDVIPFAFYELLYLKYLSKELTAEEMHKEFDEVTSISMNKHPMNFRRRMLITVRRFSYRNGTKRDYSWIKSYCQSRSINYNAMIINLKQYLSQIE